MLGQAFRRAATLLLLLALSPVAAAADEDIYAALCERAIIEGARRGGVPIQVLHAIALTETGRNANGRLRPYPWAINREGTGHWFKTREEALAFAQASIAAGRPSFDVGCVQINYRWHGHAFPSIEAMLDPEWTATYAAQFLRTLYQDRGSWSEAAGAYHSLTPEPANIYRARFDRILTGLSPLDMSTEFASLPPPRQSTRSARREAQRRVLTERLAAIGPPSEPEPGSLVSSGFVPAAGALLNSATPLLNQGSPLLGAARAGLF